MTTKILFVCMGNICRSPTAEGVMRHQLQKLGRQRQILVDSAGTHAYHAGEPPDRRSQAHALRRGYQLANLRARQIALADFKRFDWIVAMDRQNLVTLQAVCPPAYQAKLHLMMQFAAQTEYAEVPDPYYGAPAGFELVLDLVEAGCAGLLAYLDHNQLA